MPFGFSPGIPCWRESRTNFLLPYPYCALIYCGGRENFRPYCESVCYTYTPSEALSSRRASLDKPIIITLYLSNEKILSFFVAYVNITLGWLYWFTWGEFFLIMTSLLSVHSLLSCMSNWLVHVVAAYANQSMRAANPPPGARCMVSGWSGVTVDCVRR